MEMSLSQKEEWSSQHCVLNLCLTLTQQVFLHVDFFFHLHLLLSGVSAPGSSGVCRCASADVIGLEGSCQIS